MRNDLNMRVPRVMCVVNPLKVVLTNYPEGQVEELDASYYPHDVPLTGSRKVPFSRELWIERDDFMEDPPKKFFRLAPGREVRLRYGYLITCTEVVKNDAGEIVELRCTYDPGHARRRRARRPEGAGHHPLGVRGARRWTCEVRLYDKLFTRARPRRGQGDDVDFTTLVNPESLRRDVEREDRAERARRPDRARAISSSARATSSATSATRATSAPVFNRTVTLRDTWAKVKGG